MILPGPFRGMGALENSIETQQSSQAPRFGPAEIKNEELEPKWARWKGLDAVSHIFASYFQACSIGTENAVTLTWQYDILASNLFKDVKNN